MPATVALDVYRGDDHAWTLNLYSDPDALVPYDLTGATPKAEVRAVAGGQVLATFAAVVTLPNVVNLGLPAASSLLLPAGRLAWDLQLTTGASRRTVARGPVTVTADITDSTDPAPVAP